MKIVTDEMVKKAWWAHQQTVGDGFRAALEAVAPDIVEACIATVIHTECSHHERDTRDRCLRCVVENLRDLKGAVQVDGGRGILVPAPSF